MIESFFAGVLLGWGVAIPVGPITVLMMSYALQSYTKSLCIGLGASFVDMVYLGLILFGMTQIFNNEIFIKVFSIFGACYLTYMAWGIYQGMKSEIKAVKTEQNSHMVMFIKGMLLNITNPYVMMFWFSMATTLVTGDNSFVLMLSGLWVGIVSWITFFPYVVYRSRNFLSKRVMNILNFGSIAIIMGFVVYILYNAFIKTY